ncbi:MAG: hypothetical protein ACFCUJ_09185 [Thiotrichales bacterium]
MFLLWRLTAQPHGGCRERLAGRLIGLGGLADLSLHGIDPRATTRLCCASGGDFLDQDPFDEAVDFDEEGERSGRLGDHQWIRESSHGVISVLGKRIRAAPWRVCVTIGQHFQ